MKQHKIVGAVFLAALLFSSIPTASAQELVTNGGFETGNFFGWTVVDASNNTNVGTDPLFAFQGNSYANLGADPGIGTLSQTIATTPGQSYQFSFALANDITPPAGGNFFQALFGGQSVLTLNNLGDADYQLYNYNVMASSTSTTIEFRYQHGDDFFRLDSVSVVPEPSTVTLLGVASIGGLVAMRRRARRKAQASAA